MPTITTAQIKSTLQSAKQSAANKLHSAGQSTKDALKKAAEQTRNAGNRLILLIPKDYKGQGSSLNDLVRTADELGIEVQYDEKMARRLLNRYSAQQRNSLASPNGE